MNKIVTFLSILYFSFSALAADKMTMIACDDLNEGGTYYLTPEFSAQYKIPAQGKAILGGYRCLHNGLRGASTFEVLILSTEKKFLIRDQLGEFGMPAPAQIRIVGDISKYSDIILSGQAGNLTSADGSVIASIDSARVNKTTSVKLIVREHSSTEDIHFQDPSFTLGHNLVMKANGSQKPIAFHLKGHFETSNRNLSSLNNTPCEISGKYLLHPLAPTDTPSVIGFLASQITLPNSTQVTENLNYFGDQLSKGYVVSFENKNITQAMPTRELTLNSVNPKQWLNEDALPEIQVHYDNDGTARSYMVNHAALKCVFNPGQF